MTKKASDHLKAKQKKQKIVAAVLGVLFVGLTAFQVPRVMKQLHPSAPPPAHASAATATPASATGTPTLAAPTLASGSQTPAASPADSALASSTAPAVQDGQLASFSLFASKDPFAQQLSDEKAAALSPTPSGDSGGKSGSSSSSAGSAGPSVGGRAPTPGSAVISVNGTLYSVAVGTDFPQASATDSTVAPLFHLVSLTAHSAKISIVGGSYSSGAPAVTLAENKPVTLMNTADGTRYKLILKPVGTPVAAPAAAATSPTSTTVTVPPASG